MARITVEDCMQNVDNLFDLVLIAARRARQLANGAPSSLDWQNDKATVLALREIAEGAVGHDILSEPEPPVAPREPEPFDPSHPLDGRLSGGSRPVDYAASFLARLPKRKRSIGLDRLNRRMQRYLPAEQVQQVMSAYEFAAKAHEGQQRHSGEPYISHPVAVATILAELKLDAQTLMAALLHDVIEDTGVPKDHIASLFGEEVAELVDGVSKLDKIEFRSRAEAQAESFRKMLLAMVGDIRVILVKLADRTHNMRTLWIMPPEKRRRSRARRWRSTRRSPTGWA
jgi:DNA-directed RNA polymerase omega subunit